MGPAKVARADKAVRASVDSRGSVHDVIVTVNVMRVPSPDGASQAQRPPISSRRFFILARP